MTRRSPASAIRFVLSALLALVASACGSSAYGVTLSRTLAHHRIHHVSLSEAEAVPSEEALGTLGDARCHRAEVGGVTRVACRVAGMSFATSPSPAVRAEGRGATLGRGTLEVSLDGEPPVRITLRELREGALVVESDHVGARRQELATPRVLDSSEVPVERSTLGPLADAGLACVVELAVYFAGAPTSRARGLPNGVFSHRLRCSRAGWSAAVLCTTAQWFHRHTLVQDSAVLFLFRDDEEHTGEALQFSIQPLVEWSE